MTARNAGTRDDTDSGLETLLAIIVVLAILLVASAVGVALVLL